MAIIILISFSSCTHDDAPECSPIDPDPGVGENTDILLVKKKSTTPAFEGAIDDIWKEARPTCKQSNRNCCR